LRCTAFMRFRGPQALKDTYENGQSVHQQFPFWFTQRSFFKGNLSIIVLYSFTHWSELANRPSVTFNPCLQLSRSTDHESSVTFFSLSTFPSEIPAKPGRETQAFLGSQTSNLVGVEDPGCRDCQLSPL
jgi:hypothetical protein